VVAAARRIIEALDFESFYNSLKFCLAEIGEAAWLSDTCIYIISRDDKIVAPIEVLNQTVVEAIHAA
jgi:hypothetical protein